MRLWSIHPECLDQRGLVACWREALLARAVLNGKTKGYRRHPQLERFRAHPSPRAAINTYLDGIYREACRRGYRFDKTKIGRARTTLKIPVTSGQLAYELAHLAGKLRQRDPERLNTMQGETGKTHPLFFLRRGGIEEWERA